MLKLSMQAFATLGYEVCDNVELEPGFEKIALYAGADGIPTHAARQLQAGPWTSKLGRMEDIILAMNPEQWTSKRSPFGPVRGIFRFRGGDRKLTMEAGAAAAERGRFPFRAGDLSN